MSTTMRAKMQISLINKFPTAEQLQLHGVAAKTYPADGSDEDNTFAKWSPSVDLKITITNPALLGKFDVGDKFYVDFTPVGEQIMSADQTIEKKIQAKGLTAPRVTPADIEANIADEVYFTADEGVVGKYAARLAVEGLGTYPGDLPKRHQHLSLLTFCVLVLRNGFTVTGESACASPANFNAEIGRTISRENAINKLRPLMGYALKERLAAE